MKWSDRWEIKSYAPDGAVRSTLLTNILKVLGEPQDKPANETGEVQTLLMALKAGFGLEKAEAYWDGNLLLSS